jgi:hypothetical protein
MQTFNSFASLVAGTMCNSYPSFPVSVFNVSGLTQEEFDNRDITDEADFTSRLLPFNDTDVEFVEYSIKPDGTHVALYWIFTQEEVNDTEGDLGRLDWSYDTLDRVEIHE